MRSGQREFISIREAAEQFPFSRRTLWELIRTGRLVAYQPTARKTLLRRRDLDELIEHHRRERGPWGHRSARQTLRRSDDPR